MFFYEILFVNLQLLLISKHISMEQRLCLECNESIAGRTDKKFCSDQCRNTYNNRLHSDSINLVRNINNTLRKNRRILQELNREEKTRVHKDKMLEKGFNFKYFTGTFTSQKGNVYCFCYEQGYCKIDENYFLLVVNKRLKEQES